MELFILLVSVVAVWSLASSYIKRKRKKRLLEKYGDHEIVAMIMKRMFWQGQTPEQLIDSLGPPIDVDKKILKTKSKEIWKYDQRGKGRFGLRITIENGVVIGWEKKA
ncbi:hypothetical protein PWG14_08345 (plasmid) [Chromobacterium amazonense]|uniref:hypothetical protein n=1 Tax=Chromobacterium amazonense TaxID=1382803 RepID=UPI00237D898D|nr:hypothetical protein [Chromobacterium amazonense]MDE1712694.1 hypothetical protein [Chromobacterium amazonense]